MGGVKRLEGINIKKCRGESKLAVLTSPPGEENWKTFIVGRYGEEKVERFKRDAIVDSKTVREPWGERGRRVNLIFSLHRIVQAKEDRIVSKNDSIRTVVRSFSSWIDVWFGM